MPPMSLELGHYKWCHTGYHYTHFPKQLSWLYGTIRHQEQGNPSDVKFGSIEKRKKIQSIKMTKFSNSIICSTNEPNLRFLYSLFKLSLYNCDGNKYYCIVLYCTQALHMQAGVDIFSDAVVHIFHQITIL